MATNIENYYKHLNPNSVVEGKSSNLTGLFTSTFSIPEYQREYVWKVKTIEQLMNDLIEHYNKVTSNDHFNQSGTSGYFLGAMVVILKDSSIEEVVDGQQRLTTLSIICSVLLELLKRYVPDDNPKKHGFAHELEKLIVYYPSGSPKSKIIFSETLFNDFYSGLIANSNSKKIKKNLLANTVYKTKIKKRNSSFYLLKEGRKVIYQRVVNFIRKVNSKDRRRMRLISFIEFFFEFVVLLKIEANSYDSAYHIFESLNNRGIPLSQSDLIKNELLKNVLVPEEKNQVIDYWNSMKSVIEDTDIKITEFLHYSWLSRNGRVKSGKLLENIQSLIKSKTISPLQYSEYLCDDAEAFRVLFLENPAGWSVALKETLADLKNILSIKFAYPFAFSVYRQYKDLDESAVPTPEKFLYEHINLLVNFIFRYMKIGDGDVDTLSGAIADCCKLINDKKSFAEVRGLLSNLSSDESFAKEFQDISINNSKLAYYVVYKIEQFKLKGTTPLPHGVDQHLEHIMPKTPTDTGWPAALAAKNLSNNDYLELIWKVGNLIPLTGEVNSSLKNKAILVKLEGYQKTSLVSPNEVKNFLVNDLWIDSSIIERQKKLTQDALMIWLL